MAEDSANGESSGSEFVPVDAPIERVELFEDRAAVVRRVRVESAGRHRLCIGPLTALLDEQRLSFPSMAEGLVVEEVRVRRGPVDVAAPDPEVIEAQTAELQVAREQREAQADTVRRAREANLRARQASQAAQSATVRALQEQDDVQAWARSVEALAGHQAATIRAVTEAELELARLTEHETELARSLDRLKRGSPDDEPLSTSEVIAGESPEGPELGGWIELSVLAEGPAEQLIRYVVPCALWRPTHRASLELVELAPSTEEHENGEAGSAEATPQRAGRLSWATWAACWNATGEDWNGVTLICSTAREGDRVKPPPIQDDVIRLQDHELPDDPSEEVSSEFADPGVRVAADLPGVDDGGTPRVFEVASAVDLPSTGKAITVPLNEWSATAAPRWRAAPEHSGFAVLQSSQPNQSGGPLLAGPVDLVRDGTSIGQGSIPLVAEDQNFLVDWGSHPHIRIARRRSHEIERHKASGTLTHTFRVSMQVVHGGSEVCPVELRERIPVSEYTDVFVSAPDLQPATDVDGDGFCVWQLELAPQSTQDLELSYTVRSAADADLPFHGP